MKMLSLSSFDFCTENQTLRVTVSWDGEKFPNPDFSQKLNINNPKNITQVKAYELNSEQLEFAENYRPLSILIILLKTYIISSFY